MANIAIIPARGGSRRIPHKNINEFHGKPIIACSIEAAWESKLFDEVFVSTEDQKIAAIAKKYAASIIDRPMAMAEDNVGTYEVMHDAMALIEAEYGFMEKDDCVCCIYATSPLMSVDDLARGHLYMNTFPLSHCISIGYPPLQDAAQFYWSRVDALRANIPYFGISTGLVTIAPERICDINTPEDWSRAELMYAALQEKK